jgi:hypothetical protein
MSLTAILAGTTFSALTKLLFRAFIANADPLVPDSIANIGKKKRTRRGVFRQYLSENN